MLNMSSSTYLHALGELVLIDGFLGLQDIFFTCVVFIFVGHTYVVCV
jgi:hypothetical protein